ncbi:kinase-like domain-containing protein [Mycena filopes]|nr:kinase-like domain-containing protein [Mycena filopes]
MPVTLDHVKGCSPSTPKASYVPPLLSTAVASARKPSFQKHGSEKHVLFCITNAPVLIPPPTPVILRKRRAPSTMFKTPRRASAPPPPTLPVPGPFLFLNKVQSGSYGDAIAARELDSAWLQGAPGRVVCMKVFNKATCLQRNLVHGIAGEVLAYRRLANSRISAGAAFVMDLDAALQDEHRLFFVMELMDCDLLAVLNGYRFSPKDNAPRWICQIALGLAHIHACGIIHCDIKPENLLLDASGAIRISDFGSAHTRAHDAAPLEGHAVTGTYAYMAPEMLANRRKARFQMKKYGVEVDWWSLGCVAFELVAEEATTLFACEDELRKYQTWHERATTTSYLSFAGLSEDAESLVSGLLDLDPLKRYTLPDLRAHPYFFQNTPGMKSEFANCSTNPISRACQRRQNQVATPPSTPPGADSDSESSEPSSLFTLSLEPPELGTTGDDTFQHFGWINPRGIWGEEQK